jgi:NAD(P)-dependent dehydrogenase (short-subunit alcohol dehydrogenase family)
MTPFANYPSLKNRVVFVTGGASGIGAAIVEHFCAQGSRVAFVSRPSDHAQTLIDTLHAKYHNAPLFIPCDLRQIPTLKKAIAQVTAELGDISVLVNNAGHDERCPTLEISEEQWRDALASNLDHYFFAAQAVLPNMMKNQEGSIINLSSNCFLSTPPDEYIGYLTSKAAIMGMSRALAKQYGPYKIRVNCLMPGWVMTQRQLEKWFTPEAEVDLLNAQALKEKLYPEDIARMVLFLAADDSRMCTKMNVIVDGGLV